MDRDSADQPASGSSGVRIEADDIFDDDSAYGDDSDLASATTSLRSAIYDYNYENGRRYHAYRAGQYWGPNDEQQLDNIDIGHHLFTLIMGGKLFLAPIPPNPQRALDVGTGTGIWAIDFADQYPDCQVIGTDLSPTQPKEVPPNLQFEIDDACSEWTYTKDSFDYIHVRCMYGSVADWPKLYEEIYQHLKPGGYIEQLEVGVVPHCDDGSMPPDSVFQQWGEVSLAAGDAFGKTLRIVDEMKDYIVAAGFEAVVEQRYKLPLNSWPRDRRNKEIGIVNNLYWNQGLEGYVMFLLTRYLGWKVEEVHVYLAKMRAMLKDRKVHAWQAGAVVYARKPLVSKKLTLQPTSTHVQEAS